LQERREADEAAGYPTYLKTRKLSALRLTRAVGHCYAYHNLFLFLRTEEVAPALVQDAYDQAVKNYELWRAASKQVLSESIRWAYAGLLHERGRSVEAAAMLEATRSGSALLWGAKGPGVELASRFSGDFQMILAYFHTARGDRDTALGYLREALKKDPQWVLRWMRESDDFWRLRKDPEFQELLKAQ
jgi:tetratricopeptide (TPR) repeat protein